MLMKALAVKVAQYVAEYAEERDSQDHRLVVRNGQAQARKGICGGGRQAPAARRVSERTRRYHRDRRVHLSSQRQSEAVHLDQESVGHFCDSHAGETHLGGCPISLTHYT